MKTTTKLLTVLLAVVMVLAVLASCSGEPAETTKGNETTKAPTTSKTPDTTKAPDVTEDPDVTVPETTEPETTEPEETTTSIKDLISYLPEELDLGLEMSILHGRLYYDEWLLESDDGDIVGTELYGRVPRTEARLGITLNVEIVSGTKNEEYKAEAHKRQETTDPNMMVNLISGYSMDIGDLTLEGRLQNIAASDNINLENPWWPKDLLENSVIDDRVYFASGDVSPTLIYETYAIFFNRQLVDQYNIEDPIKLVNNYQWTIDKLIEITSGIYEDLDKNKVGPSKGDFFAFNFNDGAHYKPLPFAMGIRVIVPDDEEGYVWAESYTSEKMDGIVTKINDWIIKNDGVHAASEGFNDYCDGFTKGNIIFNLGNFANASHYFQGKGIDYAVVPCPMYDTDQGEYYSYYGNPTSFWAIPNNVDLDDSALLLEYLAADAYVYISPALFERALKIKYVTGEVDGLSRIFDIIRDGLVFDACMFYGQTSIGSYYNGYGAIANVKGVSWGADFDKFKVRGMQNKLKSDVVTKLRALEY